MGPSEYPDMNRDIHSMPPQTFGPYAAPAAMAVGRDQASYSCPPLAQHFGYPGATNPYISYPGATNPYMDADMKKEEMRLEILRLQKEKRDREDRMAKEQDRKDKEAHTRQMEAAHQRVLELQHQAQAHQATLVNHAAIVGMSNNSGYGYEQNYCGPISWLIGLFLFPCICFCPVDTRPVVRAAPVIAAPAALYGPAAGVPIHNAPAQMAAKY